MREYGTRFFDYMDRVAIRSARAMVPIVLGVVPARSVLDVGCGTGAWPASYREHGVADVLGIDGPYVQRDRLLIPDSLFRPLDAGAPFDLGRRFDLLQCLEVAEHLPVASGPTLVANLARHGHRVLFSAAVPGQGGEHHVNERPYEYWRGLFAQHGFAPYDCIRPLLRGTRDVAAWYACSTLLYVHEDEAPRLPAAVGRTRVPDGGPIPIVWSRLFRMRAALLRILPVAVVTRLAMLRRGMDSSSRAHDGR